MRLILSYFHTVMAFGLTDTHTAAELDRQMPDGQKTGRAAALCKQAVARSRAQLKCCGRNLRHSTAHALKIPKQCLKNHIHDLLTLRTIVPDY